MESLRRTRLSPKCFPGSEDSGVTSDVSAVVLEEEAEGAPATTAGEKAMLALDLRRAGLGRILFGSDYTVFDLRCTARVLAATPGLAPEELAMLLENRAPVLARAAGVRPPGRGTEGRR